MKIIYVNGFKIRDIFGDMNFNLLGRNPDWDYHWYIPPKEIWIEKRAKKETEFLIRTDNLEKKFDPRNKRDYWKLRKIMAQKLKQPQNISLDSITLKKYTMNGNTIRIVRGNLVRKYLDYGFIIGGHSEVYPWYIPTKEIWLDDAVEPAERKYILVHENLEYNLMKKGAGYGKAHDLACVAEEASRVHDGIATYTIHNPIAPLPFLKINELSRKRVLVVSGIHGNEPSGPYAIAKYLLQNKKTEKGIDIAPILNPTGFEKGTRKNAGGKDLNRFFFDQAIRGEPEECTIARNFLKRVTKPYELLLSIHEDYERKEFYLYEAGNGINSKVIRNIFSIIKKAGIELFNGLDDKELGNLVIDGHVPMETNDQFPALEEFVSRTRKAKRVITLEIPGRLPLERKINLGVLIIKAVVESL
ncbi:succinylglutamate desuccinylase/aspartoacylase family protein [Candidatus Jorgensenbacteria bacterium]|nr:succinylglutamate desuccinylase/aspartoacylase family protein [Candidatus Jorgensenbacteria bacterium]